RVASDQGTPALLLRLPLRRRLLPDLLDRRDPLAPLPAREPPDALRLRPSLLSRTRDDDGLVDRCREPRLARCLSALRHRRKPPELLGRRDLRRRFSAADGLRRQA